MAAVIPGAKIKLAPPTIADVQSPRSMAAQASCKPTNAAEQPVRMVMLYEDHVLAELFRNEVTLDILIKCHNQPHIGRKQEYFT